MTLRERLADWISGGALSDARHHRAHTMKHLRSMRSDCVKLSSALIRIERATRDGKSGTARKITRIAREALK